MRLYYLIFIFIFFSCGTSFRNKTQYERKNIYDYIINKPFIYDQIENTLEPNVIQLGELNFEIIFKNLIYDQKSNKLEGYIKAYVNDTNKITPNSVYIGNANNELFVSNCKMIIPLNIEYSYFTIDLNNFNVLFITSLGYQPKVFYFRNNQIEDNLLNIEYK